MLSRARPIPPVILLHQSEDIIMCRERSETHSGDMVDIRLLHHRRHSLFYGSISEFVPRVLLPDLLEIEVRSVQMLLQECQGSRVCDSGRGDFEVCMSWDDKPGGRNVHIRVHSVVVLLRRTCRLEIPRNM